MLTKIIKIFRLDWLLYSEAYYGLRKRKQWPDYIGFAKYDIDGEVALSQVK